MMDQDIVSSLKRIESGLKSFADKHKAESAQKYLNGLRETALSLIDNKDKRDELAATSEHCAFLAKSGALQLCVPLPKNLDEFAVLFACVAYSTKDQKFAKDFLAAGDRLLTRFKEPVPIQFPFIPKFLSTVADYAVHSLTARAFALFTRSASSSPGSLDEVMVLVDSVIYQYVDEVAYGERGTYGPSTINRLRFGHALQPSGTSENTPSAFVPQDHTLMQLYMLNSKGMPIGFVFADAARVHEQPALLTHYSFLSGTPNWIARKIGLEWTPFLQGIALALAVKILGLKSAEGVAMVGHTDKVAAVKAVTKATQCPADFAKTASQVAAAFSIWISGDNVSWSPPEDEYGFLDNTDGVWSFFGSSKSGYPIFLLDQSTVAPGAPGEEVPDPSQPFYQALWSYYRKTFLKTEGDNPPPIRLSNGTLPLNEFKEEMSRQYPDGLDQTQLQAIYQCLQSKVYHVPARGSAAAEKIAPINFDGCISDQLRINNPVESKKFLNSSDFLECLTCDETKFEEVVTAVNRCLILSAKKNNCGNHKWLGSDGSQMPRLTDIAFTLVGKPKPEIVKSVAKVAPTAEALFGLNKLAKL